VFTSINAMLNDERGNIAVIFALCAVPVMLIASLALDFSQTEQTKRAVRDALDSAALASVADATLDQTTRSAYARKVFADNFDRNVNVRLSDSYTNGIFTIKGDVTVPTMLGGMINQKSLNFTTSSSAKLEQEGSICVLALAPDGPNRLFFDGRIDFNAPNCAIHVNSSDVGAIANIGTGVPQADMFCAVGSGSGKFDPPMNSECETVRDPYAHLDFSTLAGNCKGGGKTQVKTNGSKGVSSTTMTPGLYCKGLKISGTNVTFDPGVYIIQDGPLWFRKGSISTAHGATFIMIGKQASLRIDHGAELFVRAPTTGKYAGLAFAQVPPAGVTDLPSASSRLSSSGHLDIEGTLYFPTQSLEINSESRFGSRSRATSFIAYEMSFTGDSVATVSVDHRAAGLPPLEPRTTGGPRIVK